MKIKIVSDGTMYGTNIVDAQTGEVLDGVTAITWSLNVGRNNPLASAQITLQGIPVEVEGELDRIRNLDSFRRLRYGMALNGQ